MRLTQSVDNLPAPRNPRRVHGNDLLYNALRTHLEEHGVGWSACDVQDQGVPFLNNLTEQQQPMPLVQRINSSALQLQLAPALPKATPGLGGEGVAEEGTGGVAVAVVVVVAE